MPLFPNQQTKAIAARIDGLSKGIRATSRKNPLNGMHVLVRAQANENAKITTMMVETMAMNKLLKKDWKSAGSCK